MRSFGDAQTDKRIPGLGYQDISRWCVFCDKSMQNIKKSQKPRKCQSKSLTTQECANNKIILFLQNYFPSAKLGCWDFRLWLVFTTSHLKPGLKIKRGWIKHRFLSGFEKGLTRLLLMFDLVIVFVQGTRLTLPFPTLSFSPQTSPHPPYPPVYIHISIQLLSYWKRSLCHSVWFVGKIASEPRTPWVLAK